MEKRIGDDSVEFLLGGYGGFDSFAYSCCKKYKSTHPSASLIFVTPYISESYQRTHLNEYAEIYDTIIYPPLENVPPKFAIIYRNRYSVEKADVIISYINHKFGGAYAAFQYARSLKKEIFNIYNEDF